MRLLSKQVPNFKEHFQHGVATDGVVRPESVANLYFFLHKQTKDAWSFDVDLRPWTTRAWFNS